MSSESASALEQAQRRRRSRHRIFWNIVNPPTRRLAGFAPWWVLLQTKGRRTGKPRTTPLARGPVDGDVVWLNSVHGRHAHWVRNLEATPAGCRVARCAFVVCPHGRQIARSLDGVGG